MTLILCLMVIVACDRRTSGNVPFSSFKTQNPMLQIDAARIFGVRDSIERSEELAPFLVDMDAFEKEDALSSNVCDWYCLKSIEYVDSRVHCDVRIDLPSTRSWKINSAIKKELFAQRDDFLSTLENSNYKNAPFVKQGVISDFHATLLSANDDGKFLSFCYSVGYYSAGAAHGMHKLHSLNFDKGTGRRITFNDYFQLETSEDSLLILDLIRSYHGQNGIHLGNVYEFDFNLQQDYITLNFDAYEIASYAYGTPRVPLNRAMIDRRFGKK